MMKVHRLLLCSDMDRTIIPNGLQPEHPGAREQFSKLCNKKNISLVYVTGRHLELVRRAVIDYQLPRPDYIITDVGTKIYRRFRNEYHELLPWQDEIAKDWHNCTHKQLQQKLKGIPGLRLQEQSKQSTFKLSFYLPLETDYEEILRHVEHRCALLELDAALVFSVDEPGKIALLDVLPRNATKLHAIEFLMKFLGFWCQETVFAGDSGNDLVVMGSSIPSILVANAEESIKQQALELARKNGNTEALYVAKQQGYLLGGNYTAGILQGLLFFYPELMKSVTSS